MSISHFWSNFFKIHLMENPHLNWSQLNFYQIQLVNNQVWLLCFDLKISHLKKFLYDQDFKSIDHAHHRTKQPWFLHMNFLKLYENLHSLVFWIIFKTPSMKFPQHYISSLYGNFHMWCDEYVPNMHVINFL